MIINSRTDFIDKVKSFKISTDYVIVKPNWVSNERGEYTEPEILDWLLEALPKPKKIVIESYTPWRGLKFEEKDTHKGKGVTLEGGKKHWEFYKRQDEFFFKSTGIGEVLKKHKAEYLNITNEFWGGDCVKPELIRQIVKARGKQVDREELFFFIPEKLYQIKDQATLISLSKIKIEESIPIILVSLSVKNLFGLLPHPSRYIPYHEEDHTQIPEVIRDLYTLYTCLFDKNLWIAEGIKTLVRNYCEEDQEIVDNQNLLFIGRNGKQVDSEACTEMGIKPEKVKHLEVL